MTPGHPMTEFADKFLERYARHWKPRTLASSSYVVRKYILPAFGHLTVDAIAVEHVRDWCLHGRDARQCQPLHADSVRDDAHGRALGIPPP